MRVLVIENDPTSRISLLGEYLEAQDVELVTVKPHHGISLPASPSGYDGAVILGGPQHAHNDKDFPAFLQICALLNTFHSEGKPLLGLCLGGQLLARSFGAKVRRNEVFEYGYLPIDITSEGGSDVLLSGLKSRQHIMQWHEDTFALPDRAVRLMTGATTDNQAFRYGNTAYGFQCHFEVSRNRVISWIEDFNHVIIGKLGEEEGKKAINRARVEFNQHAQDANEFCRVVGGRWVNLVREQRQSRAA